MTYTIADQYIEKLTKKAKAIQRKCASLGLPFTFEVKEATAIAYTDEESHQTTYYAAHVVEIEGVAKIEGWTFVAKIEHTPTGNVIKCAPDMECPKEYWDAKPHCDHCHTARDRYETFVIVDGKGNYKQVGRSCLRIYTDGLDAEACAQFAELAHTVQEESECFRVGGQVLYSLRHIVASAYELITKEGYYKDQLDWKIDRMLNWREGSAGISCQDALEAHKDVVEDIINNARILVPTNDYLHNVHVIFQQDFTEESRRIIIASYVNSYIKQIMQRKEMADRKPSNFVGEIGERITITIPVVKGNAFRVLYTKSFSATYYQESVTYVVEMVDADGNVFIWNASVNPLEAIKEAVDAGAKAITLKATVKEHSEFKGVKQTKVTRCALA